MNIEIWKRRLVYIATDVQVDGLEHDKDGLELLNNQEITILPITDVEAFKEKFTILDESRPQPGMLLLLSPYDSNTYVEISRGRSIIAIEKALLTLRFCALLGAKSVTVKNIKIVDIENSTEISIDAQHNTISGDFKTKKTEIQNLKNQITNAASLSGGQPDFEKADRLLKSSGLISDPLLKHLVEMVRESESTQNKIHELVQEVSLNQSLQNSFDLVAKIKFPLGFVSGNFKTIANEKLEYFVSLLIKFH